MALFLCFLFLLFSSATACDRCVNQGKVSYFSKASALSSGACGYGSLALGFNSGYLAAGVPSLYKEGAGCGACFQIRCKDKTLCSSKGTRVILTNLNHNNRTDFVLSSKAFMAMANKGKAQDILRNGVLDVEYKRVPCDYKNKNLTVRVEESIKRPNHLAIKVLYQGGQTEIVDVRVGQFRAFWAFDMKRSKKYGAVWEMDKRDTLPDEPLAFEFSVISGFEPFNILTDDILPADWMPGMIYDSGLQISQLEKEPGCRECDHETWK